eukprot:889657-Pyramimonas_sp.AAC.1
MWRRGKVVDRLQLRDLLAASVLAEPADVGQLRLGLHYAPPNPPHPRLLLVMLSSTILIHLPRTLLILITIKQGR